MSVEPSKLKRTHRRVTRAAERRTDIRRIVHERYRISVTYTELEGDPIEGVITDICLNGLGVIVEQPIPPGVEAEIHIHGTVVDDVVIGAAVWCQALPTTGRVFKPVSGSWRAGFELKTDLPEKAALIREIFKRAP